MPVLDSPTDRPQAKRFTQRGTIPDLQNGDRLTHEEFMLRYVAMPGVKAELINGTVYMASPVRHTDHAKPLHLLGIWLGMYVRQHPELESGSDGTVILATGSTVQPDLYLFRPESRGGHAKLVDGYVHGPPELIVEVAASTASLDANAKAEAYHAAGVPEYLLWRTQEERIDWYERKDDRYLALAPDADGLIESTLFPGLILDPDALLRGDLATVLARVTS